MLNRSISKIAFALFALGLLISACAGQTVEAGLPAAPPTPTGAPAVKQSPASSSRNQVLVEVPHTPPAEEADVRTRAAGLGMELLEWSVRTEGDTAFAVAQVCAQLPGLNWHIGRADLHTQLGTQPMTAFSAVKFEKRDGEIWRCDQLYFPWPAKAPSLTHLRLEILSVEQDVPEAPDCEALNEQLKSQGIRVQAATQAGVGGCEVVSKPQGMSKKEAYARVQQALVHAVKGPWVLASPGVVLTLGGTNP